MTHGENRAIDLHRERVQNVGQCMTPDLTEVPPWDRMGVTRDRDLAAQLCADCTVRKECLEVEFDSAGMDTQGVFGGLNEDDRRALFRHWSDTENRDLPESSGGAR
ncbi:WhiB family transcriptional regulator [Actinoalloteichus caeruleus]|uniref:WhiB family transcriptional regulator n=1 Tax=Actinoalloteichus cyanogriseus TaxID=2893586 RepID=UPI003AAD6540